MNLTFICQRLLQSTPALLVTLCVGCGSWQGGGSQADPNQAQSALHAALDAWKGGESPEALARRSPPIHVSDADWHQGLRLERYEASATGRPDGFDVNYPVVLELKDPKGKTVTRKAAYNVATHPRLAIVRQD
jgi:hypothetical protein